MEQKSSSSSTATLWFVSVIAMMQKRTNKYKTVEIIVSESDWTPPPARFPDSTLLSLKIGIKETAAQEQVRALGGRWDREKRLWVVPYGCIAGTNLEKFICVET